ncbi:MAG: pyrrolo-quinoline quinone [Acidobacteria bacterium]|nr:MAG: pyrrolo-quinoline quinone [Acidobacteriota bacterium]
MAARAWWLHIVILVLAVAICFSGAGCGGNRPHEDPVIEPPPPPPPPPTPPPAVTYSGVLTYHNDNARTGQNLQETILTPSNVDQTKFGKLISIPIDGQVYAQPLFVSKVTISGSSHNVAYVATEHDTVYAFDADAKSSTPLWSKSLIDSAQGITSIPASDLDSPISVEIGITSTPVIDGNTGTLYVLAATKENGNYVHRLHALDITNGDEKFGGPVVIDGSVPGSGDGTSGGTIAFQTKIQLQRPALLLSKGTIYIAWASFNDIGPYHGWIMAYDAKTLKQAGAWVDTPDGEEGGVWLSGAGLSADDDGNVYVVTGDGTFDVDTGGKDYGDSVVKLTLDSTGLSASDYFTPFNQQFLFDHDIDLGSSGFVLLPDQLGTVPHLGVTAGKEGRVYLLNRDDLGKFHSGDDSQIVQSLPDAVGTGDLNAGGRRNKSTAVYWNGNVYYGGSDDLLKQFKLNNGLLSTPPAAQTTTEFGYSCTMSLSANGSSNGILWALASGDDVLHAYDATNVANELYNSDQAGTRDNFGRIVRFNPPTVANGKVYVAGDKQFTIFGLLQ